MAKQIKLDNVVDASKLAEQLNIGHEYQRKAGVIHNKKEFDRLGVPIGLDVDTGLAYTQLAENQTVGEQLLNTVVGGAKQTAAGIIDYLATWDLSQGIDALQGNQRDYGDNLLHQWAASIRENVQQNNPIYQSNPGEVDFTDFAWLGNQLQQLGYSAGMIVAMLGEQAVIGAVTGGTGNAATLAKIGRLPTLFQKVKALYGTAGNLGRIKNLGYGLFSGYREAELNMAHTYDEIKQSFLDEGYSLQEAQKFAAEGAATSFQTELIPTMFSNMAQFAMMGYNPATRQFTNKFERGLSNAIKNKYLRGATNFAVQGVSEGAEEVWQGMASNKGKEFADYLAGKRANYSFFSSQYLGTHDMWNEFIGGFLGGAVFQGLGNISNRFEKKRYEKALIDASSRFQQDITARRIQNLDQLRMAREHDDERMARQMMSDNNFFGGLGSLHIDARNDNQTELFQSYLDMLEGALNSVQNNNVEELEKFFPGLEIDIDMLADYLPEAITDAKRLQQLYQLESGNNHSFDAIIPIVYRQFEIEKNNKSIEEINQTLAELETQLPRFSELSPVGRQIYQGRMNIRTMSNNLPYIQSRIKWTKDAEEREALQNTYNALKDQIKSAEESLENIDYYEGDDAARTNDQKVMLSLGENRQYLDLVQVRENIRIDNELMNEELITWKDTYFQSELVQRAIQNDFDNANTIREIKEFEVALNRRNFNTQEWRDKIEQKKRLVQKQDRKKTEPTPTQPVQQTITQQTQTQDDLLGIAVPNEEVQNAGQVTDEVINPLIDKLRNNEQLTPQEQEIYNNFKSQIDQLILQQPATKEDINLQPTVEEEEQLSREQIANESSAMSLKERLLDYQRNYDPTILAEEAQRPETTAKDDLIDMATQSEVDDSYTIDDNTYENFAIPVNNEAMAANPNLIQAMEDFFSRFPTFEAAIEQGYKNDRDFMEENYEALRASYEIVYERLGLPKMSPAQFSALYNKLFDSYEVKLNRLVDLLRPYRIGQETNAKQVQQERIDKTKVDVKPDIRTPIIRGYKVNESSTKLAYVVFPTTLREIEEGVYVREVSQYEVNHDPFIDATPLLNAQSYQAGTRLVARIPENVMDIPVYIWNMDNTKINRQLINGREVNAPVDTLRPIDRLPFGEALAKYPQIANNEELYNEIVPILVYDPRMPQGSKAIGAVHNVDWWNVNNVNDNSAESKIEVAKNGAANVKAQRNAIINNGGQINLVVTNKSLAKVDRLYDNLGNNIYTPINQQNPDVQLAIYEQGGFNTGNSVIPETQLANPEFTKQIGGSYYMIPAGVNENGQTMYEFAQAYTNNSQLKPEIADSIFNVIQAYVTNIVVPNPQIAEQLRSMGITDNYSLEKYITQFLQPLPGMLRKKNELEVHEWLETSNFETGEIYFRTTPNSITLFKVKEQLGRYKNQPVSYISIPTQIGGRVTDAMVVSYLNTFLKNNSDDAKILSARNTVTTHPIRLNLDKNRLATDANVQVMEKGEGGTFIVRELESYSSVMKDMFTTNIAGLQATDGSYHSATQATITYDVAENSIVNEVSNVVESAINPVIEAIPEFQQLQESTELTDIQSEFLETIQTSEWIEMEERFPGTTLLQAKQLFPQNFDEYFNEDGTIRISEVPNENYALPNRLTERDIEILTQSSIRLKDVSKTQLNDVVNFLTGNIYTELLNQSGQVINKRELFGKLQTALNEMVGDRETKLNNLIQAMTKFGTNLATQSILDTNRSELQALQNIKNSIIPIINFTMDNIQQELNIKEVDRNYRPGDVVANFEIDAAFQDLFDVNTPIEFIQYNDNGTIKVKQTTENNVIETDITLNTIDDLLEFQQDEMNDDFGEMAADLYRNNENERNFSKTSLEQDPKQAMNTKIKMLLKTLTDINTDGTTRRGSFNLPQYNTVDNLWKKLQSVLTNNNLTGDMTVYVNNEYKSVQGTSLALTSNFSQMIEKLKQVSEANPWVNQLIEKLQDSSQSVKNAFAYDMYKHAISMCKVHVSYSENRNNIVTILDANSNEIIRVIQNEWRSSLANQSPLTLNIGQRKTYNLGVIDSLLKQYQDLRTAPILTTFNKATDVTKLGKAQKKFLQDLRKWLDVMGIHITPQTLNHLVVNGLARNNSNGYNSFINLFGSENARTGELDPMTNGLLFAALNRRLQELREKTALQNADVNNLDNQIDYINQEYNQLTYNMGGMLNRLAKVESQFTKTVITTVHNEGGKNINDITNFNFITQSTEELKANNNNERTTKLGFAYDGKSFDLQLLETPAYQQQMQMRYISPEALTQYGVQFSQDNKVPVLADIDYEYVKLAGLMYTKAGIVNVPAALAQANPNISFRMGHIFNPTSSDKDQVFFWKKAVIDFKLRDFITDANGNIIGVQNDVINFVKSQTVTPELARIIEHHKKAYAMLVNPNSLNNHDGYNYAAQHFSMIPAMNNILIDDMPIIQYIAEEIAIGNNVTVESIYEAINSQVNELLGQVINNLITEKQKIWQDNGYFGVNENDNTIINLLDLGYFTGDNRQGNGLSAISNENKIRALSYDFVINNLVSNANYFMMYAGDIANYALNKHYTKRDRNGNLIFFEQDEAKQPIVYKPRQEYADTIFNYMTINGQIDTNLGKRLAAMIAPRSAIANSQYDKFNQIVVLDQAAYALNLDYLINLYHGDEGLTQAKPILDRLSEINTNSELTELDRRGLIARALNELSELFPDLASYMDITSTDGQEYTTWQEALDTVFRQGRLEDEMYERVKDKLTKGQDLTKDELIVFQPNKPVYNGYMNDEGYTKMVYVKTSSFPLLPQFTKAFPNGVDKARQYMERIQQETGRNTRMVYVSGMKMGLPIANKIPNLWNSDGTFNEELNNIGFNEHSLILDRKYWGIQQDTPYKSGYKKEDKVSIGTQMMKILPTLLFKVMNSAPDTKFTIDGKTYTGEQLYNRINREFSGWIEKERQKLYNELDIDPIKNKPRDLTSFMKKMNNLLMSEAKKRNYSPQDIDSLKLVPITNKNGDLIDVQFSMPIYFTPNSNKYEGLLNSIISSRLIDLKMPGNAYIVASEEGWINAEGDIATSSDIIFTSKWTGKLLPQREVNGKILPAQVIASPKFRMADGTMLDLLSRNDDGTYRYVNVTDNGFTLKEDMIDPDLLIMNSFRIPYSGPQSGPTVEIVGFFVGEKAGDLMIVSKNHVTQIGEDFDVDKRYTYQMWNFVDSNGRVRKLEKAFSEDLDVDTIINLIDSARKYIDRFNSYRKELREVRDMGDMTMVGSLNAAISDLANDVAVDADAVGIAGIENRIRNILYNFNYAEKAYTKLLQNEIIKGYTSTTLSNSPIIQREMNKILSTSESEQQGKILETLRQQSVDNSLGTLLSDEYQKRKMKSGATAKLGIAIYSNALVMHNMIQQSQKPIVLQKIVKKELPSGKVVSEIENVTIQFGNILTDGILGKEMPVQPKYVTSAVWNRNTRSIGDIFNELQNVSTDNEKLQLYGKLGLNAITTNVDVIMTMLGLKYDFLEDGTKISLPHFLISQPIVQNFVTKLQNKQANLADFDIDAEKNVLAEILVEGDYNTIWNSITENQNEYWKLLTGKELHNQLQDATTPTVQLAALNFFLEMKDYMFLLSKNYANLNIQSSALGRSIFDVQNVEEGFNTFLEDTITDQRIGKAVLNMNALVGDFLTQDEYESLPATEAVEYKWYEAKGYWFRPSTINGNMLYNSIVAHNNLFNNFYPFASDEFNIVFQQILNNLGYREMSKSKKVRLKEKVFQEVKKFIFSHRSFGLYSGDIQAERHRLTKDTRDRREVIVNDAVPYQRYANGEIIIPSLNNAVFKLRGKNTTDMTSERNPNYILRETSDGIFTLFKIENVETKLSLPSYLERLVASDSQGALIVKNNFLIQDFSYDINVNQGMSFIRYRTVSEKNYDQEDIYNALIDLLERDVELDAMEGWNNGQPYSTRELAEDLIINAYLNQGGVQSAIEYVKNIPVSILERIAGAKNESFAKKLRRIQDNFIPKYEVNQDGTVIKSANPFAFNLFGYTPSNVREDGNIVEMASVVQRQIVQNNPSWGKKITGRDYVSARTVIPDVELQELGITSDVNVIAMKEGRDTGLQFVVEYSSRAKKESGKPYKVFERIANDIYKEIPTLGNSFIHEYDPSNPYIKSVGQVSATPNLTPTPVVTKTKDVTPTTLPFNIETGSVQDILQGIADSRLSLSDFAAKLLELDVFKQPVNITLGNKWSFNRIDNVVVFNAKDLASSESQELIASRVMEELLHSVLTPFLVEHFNGGTDSRIYKNSERPDFITDLGALFLQSNRAIRRIVDSYEGRSYEDTFNTIMKAKENGTFLEYTGDYVDELVYSVSDIFEFTARLLSNPSMVSRLGNIQYSGNTKTILQRFKEIIQKFLYSVGIRVEDGSIAAQGINEMFSLLETLGNRNDTTITDNTFDDGHSQKEAKDLMDAADDVILTEEAAGANADIEGGKYTIQFTSVAEMLAAQSKDIDDLIGSAVPLSQQEMNELNNQKEQGC